MNDRENASHGETHFPLFGSQDADGGKYLLGEGDQEAAEQTQKALGALACVVGLDGHTDLDDAPSRMMPMARIAEKMKSDRLLTTVRGSAAARAGTVPNVIASTAQAHAVKMRMIFGWLFFMRFLL